MDELEKEINRLQGVVKFHEEAAKTATFAANTFRKAMNQMKRALAEVRKAEQSDAEVIQEVSEGLQNNP